MKKFNTSPISGMQELLPNLQYQFNHLKSGIMAAFARHGFQSIETPIIERMDILLAKAGGETEKQIYKVVKTAESADSADQALRFDHTVPLARYVVEHMSALTFPFKVSQVNRNFRGERPQKGRFREFYQCDVDVIGWQKLPLAYDAEIICTLTDALEVLPIKKYLVRVSNRKILSGLLEALGITHHSTEIFSIVDHAEKIPLTATEEHLADLQIGAEKTQLLLDFMQIHGSRTEVMAKLQNLSIKNELFQQGCAELDKVLELLDSHNGQGKSQIIADMMIVRGLDYYTGTVFETIAPDYREFGSVCSGGRYDNLAQNYTDQSLPGVGGSIGLTRLFAAMCDAGLITVDSGKTIDICLVPISESEFSAAENLAQQLRKSGKNIDINFIDKKLSDKIKYASKVSDRMVVIGEDEAKTGNYQLKNLLTGEQSPLEV